MLAYERRGQILEATGRTGYVRVADLVRSLEVSDVTIRRDLDVLVDEGLIEKVHGGARRLAAASGPAAAGTGAADAEPVHIGVMLPSAAEHFRRIVAGIEEAASAAGARLSMSVSQYHPDREEQLARGLLDSGVQGLLLVPTLTGNSEDGSWVAELSVPAVLIEREFRAFRFAGTPSVRTAHEHGAARAVHHLHDLGHRRIGLITRGDSQVAEFVREGWRWAVEELGLATDVPIISGKDVGSWPRWDEVDVEKVVASLCAAHVTGLLCHNDEGALAIMDHARSIGWSVPDDLSVVAYEDEIGQLASPPLTAVAPLKEEVGAAAVAELIAVISTPERSPRHLQIEPQLTVRDSTTVPRSDG